MRKFLQLIGFVFAFSAGALPAFFIIMLVFDDIFSIAERLFTFAMVVVVYGIIGMAFGYLIPRISWRWGIWLSIPVCIITDWYSVYEPARLALHFLYLMTAAAAACLGAESGALLAQRKLKK